MGLRNEAQRVLHVTSAMNRGGAETLLMNVHRNMDRFRVQFDYVSHRHEKCDFDDEIEALGGRVYRISSLGRSGPLGYLRELNKIMTGTNYAAVHAHTDYQSGFAALAAKNARIRKRICHSHSSNWQRGEGLKASVTLGALRAVMKYSATDYCACSKEAARFLFGSALVDSEKVRIVRNGIDLHPFASPNPNDPIDVRQEFHIAPETKILGHVGRFSESKNHTFLLKLLRKMKDEGRDVAALLVGDGPLKREIAEEAERLGIGRHIRFAGVRSDIPRLMRAFDAFVFPSRFEGFGIVALEAQACGTPCVAADTVPKATDLGLGLLSFISLDADPDVWIKAIDEAFMKERPDDRIIRTRFSESGYDIKQNVQEWMALYGI